MTDYSEMLEQAKKTEIRGTYRVATECLNCGNRQYTTIPKETLMSAMPCGNCGCVALRRPS